MNTLIIIIGVIVLIVLIISIFFIRSKMKGKVVINLDKYDYSPGETVTGTLMLKLKKPVNAKSLKVGLTGISKNTQYNKNLKGKTSKSTRKGVIFDFRKPIDGKKEYPAGEKTYNFNVLIPKNLLSQSGLEKGVIGTLIKSAQTLSGNITNIKWYIIANLEMPGFDISKKVQINIG